MPRLTSAERLEHSPAALATNLIGMCLGIKRLRG